MSAAVVVVFAGYLLYRAVKKKREKNKLKRRSVETEHVFSKGDESLDAQRASEFTQVTERSLGSRTISFEHLPNDTKKNNSSTTTIHRKSSSEDDSMDGWY